MRQEQNHNDLSNENIQAAPASNQGTETHNFGSAFEYLKSLPRNFDRPALESYIRDKTTAIIDHEVAEQFTDGFRSAVDPFYIPLSWSMTKSGLLSLLGITDYDGYEEVTGVRFYAGLNGDNQLTLIAVSTMEGIDCDDDLTVDDEYPYYDYADPCPSSCSRRGNLKAAIPEQVKVIVTP